MVRTVIHTFQPKVKGKKDKIIHPNSRAAAQLARQAHRDGHIEKYVIPICYDLSVLISIILAVNYLTFFRKQKEKNVKLEKLGK